jgi:hypothetical protein
MKNKLKINENNRKIIENPNEFFLSDVKKILVKSTSLNHLYSNEIDKIITMLGLILCSNDNGEIYITSEDEIADFINENFSYLKECAINILIKIFGN